MAEPAAYPTALHKAVNAIHYEVGWFACVLGAAHGMPWLGPAVVALLAAFDLAVSPQPHRQLAFILTAGALGFGLDTLQAALGAFSFAGQARPWLCPPWMVALWIIFATMFHSALSWLRGRYLLGAVLGALGGPLAYYAGATLGPIVLGDSMAASIGLIAMAWTLATPLLIWLSGRIGPDASTPELIAALEVRPG